MRVCAVVAVLSASLLSLPAFSATCAGAGDEALSWLQRMSRSSHEVDYHGVVTFQRGEDMQVMQVSHSVRGGTTSESITRLTGQGARVERTDHPLECVHPGHKILQLGMDLAAGNCGLAEFYRFAVSDGERIAGRRAVRITVQPRDMYRYGYVMDLDRETALLLKARTVGRGDRTLEKFQFASLTYGDAPADHQDVEVVHRAQHPQPASAESNTAALPRQEWGVHWLPRGFAATEARVAGEVRRTYTDGLAVFSIFLEELPTDIRPGEGIMRHGGTVSYTRGLQLADKPVLITVIGEVPVNTARMVADSVRWSR